MHDFLGECNSMEPGSVKFGVIKGHIAFIKPANAVYKADLKSKKSVTDAKEGNFNWSYCVRVTVADETDSLVISFFNDCAEKVFGVKAKDLAEIPNKKEFFQNFYDLELLISIKFQEKNERTSFTASNVLKVQKKEEIELVKAWDKFKSANM